MQFQERVCGTYRIFVGAIEAPGGDGFTAAMIVQSTDHPIRGMREVVRDESLACGHRWSTAAEALSYAMSKAQEAVRQLPPPVARQGRPVIDTLHRDTREHAFPVLRPPD